MRWPAKNLSIWARVVMHREPASGVLGVGARNAQRVRGAAGAAQLRRGDIAAERVGLEAGLDGHGPGAAVGVALVHGDLPGVRDRPEHVGALARRARVGRVVDAVQAEVRAEAFGPLE